MSGAMLRPWLSRTKFCDISGTLKMIHWAKNAWVTYWGKCNTGSCKMLFIMLWSYMWVNGKINILSYEVSCTFVIYVFYAVLWWRELRQGKAFDKCFLICLCYLYVHVIITQHLAVCGICVMKTLFKLHTFYVTFVRLIKHNLSAV